MDTATSVTDANRALMRRMYDWAAAGDYQDVLKCLSDDLVGNEPPVLPYGGVYRGIPGMRELIAKVTQVPDVSKLTVDRLVADGEGVIGIIRMPDLKTGEDVLLAEESLICDGKVVEIFVYFHETRTLTSTR